VQKQKPDAQTARKQRDNAASRLAMQEESRQQKIADLVRSLPFLLAKAGWA